MVDLISASLISSVQRQSVPNAARSSEPSLLELGSETLTNNPSNQSANLLFGPSAGLFTDNNTFATLAAAGSDFSNTQSNNSENEIFNLNNNNSRASFDLFNSSLSNAQARLLELTDPNNQPVFEPKQQTTTEANEETNVQEIETERTTSPDTLIPASDTTSPSSGDTDTGGGSNDTGGGTGDTGGGDTTTGPGNSGNNGNSGDNNGNGGVGKGNGAGNNK